MNPSNLTEARWLKLRTACNYAQMGKEKMLYYVETGRIYGTMKTGKWIIDRLSIDAFLLEDKLIEDETVANIAKSF